MTEARMQSGGPSRRSQGGFRLHADDDVARLELIRRLTPSDFSIEDMREVLLLLDEPEKRMDSTEEPRPELLERLATHREPADQRVAVVHARWSSAAEFAAHLRGPEERLRAHRRIRS